jgi:transcriptional regulator with PAS, ATPase and Fis domain
VRICGSDRTYRWFLARFSLVRDDDGNRLRWYCACTDIEDRKRHEETLLQENAALRAQISQWSFSDEIIGSSEPLRRVLVEVGKVARTDSTVLILGETGSGKELIARAIHRRSRRAARAFVGVNCAAIPSSLIASELFGHEKGAFTGALERRAGCFELAQNGTLLLDEIGDMPVATQAKLLRVLEDSRVRRLGGKGEILVDVRVIASTNKVLAEALKKNELREDLYYRLNVFHIGLPPLRARLDDLPLLAEALLNDLNRKHGTKIVDIAPEVLDEFQRYHWPGNVRELRNTLERAVILTGEGTISKVHLPGRFNSAAAPEAGDGGDPAAVRLRVGSTIDEAEKALIQHTLQHTKNNKTRAAEILGISLKTLHNKLKEYGAAEAEA